jgi:hypothetical protein
MKTFSQFIEESTDPKGPIKKYMSPEEIAKKHKISLKTLNSQLEMGIKVESEHTGSKKMARMIALQHLEEFPDYYSRLKKAEKIKEATDGIKAKDYKGRLDRWFDDGGWVQAGGKYDGKPCARQPGQTTKPYCRDPDDRAAMSKKERNKRAAKKRREDPNPNESGKAKMVTQESAGEKDACYKKVKSRYKKWPSAYASGALVKCRKVGAKNWGNKTEETNYNSLPDWEGRIYEDEQRYCPKCQKMERAAECKYGPKFWSLYSSAVEPSDQTKNGISKIDVIKNIEEKYTRIQSRGSTYTIMFNWRGKYLSAQMFFPQFTRPSKLQVTYELRKIYPDAIVLTFNPSPKDPTKPLLFTGELDGPR